jgi:hypothetical protein
LSAEDRFQDNTCIYRIGRLDIPKIDEIYQIGMAPDGNLKEEVMTPGAGAAISFAFYEADGGSSERGFGFSSEDFPSIMPENGSPIWPLILNIGKDRFQESDMRKLHPDRLLINHKDGALFGCPVIDLSPPKVSYPTLCEMTGLMSRFTNITMTVSRLLSAEKAEGLDNLAPIFLNVEKKPVFIWSQLNSAPNLVNSAQTPDILVLDPTDSTNRIPYTIFRWDEVPGAGLEPLDLHSYMANPEQKTVYLVYSI